MCFEDGWFRYPDRNELPRGASLDICADERVHLIGSTGAGKSTLAHDSMRLIKPGRDRITIDGIDISQEELSSLRRQIGLIDENSLLLCGAVTESID